MNNSNDKFISIAKILNFHGIKGEVKLGFTKGQESHLKSVKHVFARLESLHSALEFEFKQLNIELLRFHKDTAIVKFKEFASVNDVLPYKGCCIYALKAELENELEDNEYFISDLTGMEVFDEDGACIGVVSEIGESPANDILVIQDGNNKKHLVPFVKALVPAVDTKNKRIVINNIEGLIS